MVKVSLMMAVALCALGSGPAMAAGHHRMHHHHHVYRRHYRHRRYGHGPYTIGYGETIISGRTGLHRSIDNVMVPDSEPPGFVLSGRKRGSGIGANGLPGSNADP